MADTRIAVLGAAAFLGAWHLGFLAGQTSKRPRSNRAQVRDVIGTYRAAGVDRAAARRMVMRDMMKANA